MPLFHESDHFGHWSTRRSTLERLTGKKNSRDYLRTDDLCGSTAAHDTRKKPSSIPRRKFPVHRQGKENGSGLIIKIYYSLAMDWKTRQRETNNNNINNKKTLPSVRVLEKSEFALASKCIGGHQEKATRRRCRIGQLLIRPLFSFFLFPDVKKKSVRLRIVKM